MPLQEMPFFNSLYISAAWQSNALYFIVFLVNAIKNWKVFQYYKNLIIQILYSGNISKYSLNKIPY